MENITIIVKTLDRYNCLVKFLKSVYKKYPTVKVLIGDDSHNSSKDKILKQFKKYDIEYYNLEEDCGLSAGRNYLLNKVKTNYFILADDDFIFDSKTDIESAFNIFKEKDLDILGGYIRNYKIVKNKFDELLVFFEKILKYELPTNYIGQLKLDGDIFYANYIVHSFPEYTDTDLVLNFFIGKTEKIKEIGGWDNNLKLQEHTEFFYRSKINNLKVGFTSKLSVQHHPYKLKGYDSKRNRNYTSLFMDKYGIKKIVANYDDKRGQKITLRSDLEE